MKRLGRHDSFKINVIDKSNHGRISEVVWNNVKDSKTEDLWVDY
jgi:hypothetical protein